MRGTVKWFNAQKGYGFLVSEDAKEYFFHQSEIKMGGFRKLDEGDIVSFKTVKPGNARIRAVNVEPILTVSMLVHELSKERLHIMRIRDDKGFHGWYVVDELENPVVDKEMNLEELAAFAGFSVNED